MCIPFPAQRSCSSFGRPSYVHQYSEDDEGWQQDRLADEEILIDGRRHLNAGNGEPEFSGRGSPAICREDLPQGNKSQRKTIFLLVSFRLVAEAGPASGGFRFDKFR
jgi:hypothetical protein